MKGPVGVFVSRAVLHVCSVPLGKRRLEFFLLTCTMELVEKGKENLATNDAYTIAALLVIEGHHKPESKHRSQPASQQARLRGASGNFCAI